MAGTSFTVALSVLAALPYSFDAFGGLPLALVGLAVGVVGHATFWIALANQARAVGFPRWLVKVLCWTMEAIVVFTPIAVLVWLITSPDLLDLPRLLQTLPGGYLTGCWASAATLVPYWTWQRLSDRRPASFVAETTITVDLQQELGSKPIAGGRARMLSHVPGNQLLDLQINEKTLAIPGLPGSLDGLRIVHLSDLHLSGRLTIDYFRCIARHVRELEADLIVISGDVCDKDHCIDWINDCFAGLQSRYGNYYVLGNHDLRVRDIRLVRHALDRAGFIDIGGKCEMSAIHGERVLIAGNERPWIKPPRDFEQTLQKAASQASFRLLVSHSPDQMPWARRHGFDLVLAGHTHGGQIRFPVIGPLVCPSRFNVRYACGVFHEGQTLMHVSRGTASLFPLRINCPPEITTVILRKASPTA